MTSRQRRRRPGEAAAPLEAPAVAHRRVPTSREGVLADSEFYAKNFYETRVWRQNEGYLEIVSMHNDDSDVFYVNYFYPDGRIVANSNYGKSKNPSVKGLHNNTMIWLQYLRAREFLQDKLPAAPTELHRSPVVNKDTNDVIWMCLPEDEKVGEFAPATDDFHALLGTENGRAAAFMILDSGVAKGIASIAAEIRGASGHLAIRFDQPATSLHTPVIDTGKAKGDLVVQ